MSTTKRFWFGAMALALVASVAMVGYSADKKAEKKPPPINDKCPLTGKDVNAKKTCTIEVSFCCANCKKKFDADPAKFLAKVSEVPNGKCPLSGKDISDKANSKVTIGLCCGNCQKKFAKDPAKYLGKVKAAEKDG